MYPNNITRRRFMRNASILAAAGATGIACSDGSDRSAQRRAVVIGSGFAGSVAALRLGQAGINTTVIERGQAWTLDGPDSFPTLSNTDERTTWFGQIDALTGRVPVTPYAGMIQRIAGDTVDAVGASCLGGGSLVYGGVLLQPRRDVFNQVFPQIDYDQMDQVYYPRVLQEIGAASIPDGRSGRRPIRRTSGVSGRCGGRGLRDYPPGGLLRLGRHPRGAARRCNRSGDGQ